MKGGDSSSGKKQWRGENDRKHGGVRDGMSDREGVGEGERRVQKGWVERGETQAGEMGFPSLQGPYLYFSKS